MSKLRFCIMRMLYAASVLALLLSFSGVISARAQAPDPACPKPACPASPGNPDLSSQATATLKLYTKVTQKGWYSTAGVGMVNRGYGTISLASPAGSAVTKAYLYWVILAPKSVPGFTYKKGFINGHAITGSLVATTLPDVWYPNTIMVYAYRADVKAYVNKNVSGTYLLTGFASGETDGVDPWGQTSMNYPLSDGASLVVFYSNPNYPTSTVQLYNGAFRFPNSVHAHLTISGVNAVYPTGLANTTFIGAEGAQSSGYDGVTSFFETNLPDVTWNGTVANGNGQANFSHGNLWDNVSVDLHSLLNPPENDFWFSTHKPVWTPIWVAQVLAYSSGAQDTDGDGLPDGWELNGFDANRDGYVDVPLPAYGASMFHKDLFVEADYMSSTGAGYNPPYFLPPKTQLDDIVSVFNNAPVNNPDGTTGIHIHIDTGGADATNPAGTYSTYNLGGGNSVAFKTTLGASSGTYPNCGNYDWSQFQTLKNSNFYSYRLPIFHYVIFANELSPCQAVNHTSGISRNGWPDSVFIKGATDFIVALGGWNLGTYPYAPEGTFIHELGHNLGLRHGGNDHVNYKPNYLSVMNYFFQMTGVWRDGNYHFDYSSFLLPSLNENSLKEPVGLGPLTIPHAYATKYYCPNGSVLFVFGYPWIDWNCDGIKETSSVKADLNYDGKKTTLGSQNNWASITFKGNGVIGSGEALGEITSQALPITYWVNELTSDEVDALPPGPPQ